MIELCELDGKSWDVPPTPTGSSPAPSEADSTDFVPISRFTSPPLKNNKEEQEQPSGIKAHVVSGALITLITIVMSSLEMALASGDNTAADAVLHFALAFASSVLGDYTNFLPNDIGTTRHGMEFKDHLTNRADREARFREVSASVLPRVVVKPQIRLPFVYMRDPFIDSLLTNAATSAASTIVPAIKPVAHAYQAICGKQIGADTTEYYLTRKDAKETRKKKAKLAN